MTVAWDGHILGEFVGYAYHRVHELSDGSRWIQRGRAQESVYRERPAARLRRDRGSGQVFLDVEGTSGVVEVVPDRRWPGSGSWGAY